MSLPQRESVLFITSAELGQANVIIATAYEFLLRDEFDVHIASYAALGTRVQWLNQEIHNVRHKSSGDRASKSEAAFHELSGMSLVDYSKERNILWPHKTDIGNLTRSFNDMARIAIREDHHNYLRTYDSASGLIRTLIPTIVVVDPMCHPGKDACRESGANFVELCPFTYYEICGARQPRGAILWKYPAPGSGFPYPLPWNLVPLNIYIIFQFVLKFRLGPVYKSLTAARLAHGIKPPIPIGVFEDRVTICPSLPEIDLPMSLVPQTVFGVGPILLPIRPISASDPGLDCWMTCHPTILVNLGTHHVTDSNSACEMAISFATILSENLDLQILWKLKYDYSSDNLFNEIISSHLSTDRIRMSAWILPESTSILASPKTVAFVHHGGANSYYEACYSGVPQVILPTWFDTYQNAARVEFLGIGVFANKKHAPGVEREEFTTALRRVLRNEEMKDRATVLGALCQRRNGRELAFSKIVEVARSLTVNLSS